VLAPMCISAYRGIIVALIIATVKGSLVAGYFMHLFSEKKLIYMVLALTAAVVVVLAGCWFSRTAINRGIGTESSRCRSGTFNRITRLPRPPRRRRKAAMSLKAFHVVFITLSVLLCLGFGVWCLDSDYARTRPLMRSSRGFVFARRRPGVYEIFFLRKLRGTDKLREPMNSLVVLLACAACYGAPDAAQTHE